MDIYYLIGLIFWAIVNYFIAKAVSEKVNYMIVNPVLYAVGSVLFGGIFPLIFLVIKYVYCSYRVRNK